MKGLYFNNKVGTDVYEIISEPMPATNTNGYDNRIVTTIVVVTRRLSDNECITWDVDHIGELFSEYGKAVKER